MTDLTHYTSSGAISVNKFDEDHRAAQAVSMKHLESADIERIVSRAQELTAEQNLLLPDERTLLERCVSALLVGHLILQGPPGTGKTTLAHILAEAFNATAHLETATADWSTYDVIGGLHPSTGDHGMETLEPWLGHVPRAALHCASVIAHQADPDFAESHQAHWLIIDEFNRAEIDKAIGPLYTILGGGGPDKPLPLWFEDDDARSVVWLPHRFRIIGTMNTVDTNYVYSFSQGLTRRFQFVYVGVPTSSQVAAELLQARTGATDWYLRTYGADYDDTTRADLVDDPRLKPITDLIASLLKTIRYADGAGRPGWPLGTAQLVDVYRQILLRLPHTPDDTDLRPVADLALADRIIPQASNLLSVQLDALELWLGQQTALPRTAEALQHLRAASSTGY